VVPAHVAAVQPKTVFLAAADHQLSWREGKPLDDGAVQHHDETARPSVTARRATSRGYGRLRRNVVPVRPVAWRDPGQRSVQIEPLPVNWRSPAMPGVQHPVQSREPVSRNVIAGSRRHGP